MPEQHLVFSIAYSRESDGRYIAEIAELPEVLPAYGDTEIEARRHVMALAFYWLAHRIDDGNTDISPSTIEFKAA